MAEVYETIYLNLELKKDDGTTWTEGVRLRYNYTSGQSLDQVFIMVNAFDLALLIETFGAENFESLEIKLQVHLTKCIIRYATHLMSMSLLLRIKR